MNDNHAYCASPEWEQLLSTEILPWLLLNADLGAKMLEVGPGPGASTNHLRHKVENLVAVEYEPEATKALTHRFSKTNVQVLQADATTLPFPPNSFDSAASFTMLHHLPTIGHQNRLLSEVLRTLRPGAPLIGSDSLPSNDLHHFHESDTYNPAEPATLLTRLQTLGYTNITLRVHTRLSFIAHKPTE